MKDWEVNIAFLQPVTHSWAGAACCPGRGMQFETMTALKGGQAVNALLCLLSGALQAEGRAH